MLAAALHGLRTLHSGRPRRLRGVDIGGIAGPLPKGDDRQGAAAASALVIAPTAFHRLMFRARDKPHLIAVSSKLAIGGLVCLAIAMNGAVLLVTDVLFDGVAVVVTVAITAALFVGLWFVLGIVRRLGSERSH